jgi:flagellar biosynthetic protein FlhB
MSKEEVSRESKDAEQSPLVRAHVRKLRSEIRKRWTMQDVERATAVVTNPEHFAVALEYRPQTMPAPVVVAKGMNEVALRIREAARWHGIPIVENPPLAQALYRATEVGEAIPAKLYTAVAEILAFLYRTQASLRNSVQAARAAAGPPSGMGR